MEAAKCAEVVREILLTDLHLEVPSDDFELIESGHLDSLTFVELVFHLERRLGVEFDIETLDLDNLRTVSRIAAFVSARG